MVLVQKWQFFQLFFFKQYRLRKRLLSYSRTKKSLSRLSKQEDQKVEKLAFFQRVQPVVLFQKWPFFNLGNICQETVFHDILKRKNAFLGYKNKKYKQSKIDIFLKGITHGFGSIMAIFQTCSFLSIQAGKMFFMIFQNKKYAFLGYKNKKIKKAKN